MFLLYIEIQGWRRFQSNIITNSTKRQSFQSVIGLGFESFDFLFVLLQGFVLYILVALSG